MTKLPSKSVNIDPVPAIPAELMVWLSPAFPISGFAYSQGLEAAVDRAWVSDRTSLENWLNDLTRHGGLWNDLVLLSLVNRAADKAVITQLVELGNALHPSSERHFEATTQGASFRAAYRAGWRKSGAGKCWCDEDEQIALPVAVGLAARDYQMDLGTTLLAYGVHFQTNLVSAAMRLSVIGQFDAQKVLAALLPDLTQVAAFALVADEDDLGGATFGADLASIFHETQTTRLFRS